MTTAIKRRRGTTTQHSTFTGLEGELTVDTTKDTVVVHDGATAGGFPLAKESQATTNVAITGGTISGITDLAIADGGTGASTAANARTNLGVTATGADTTYAYRANNLSDLASASTARSNLGLGTIATQAASSVAVTGGAIDGTVIGGTAAAAVSSTNLSYTGTLTGGTGVVNIGSGQFYKDASGNVGVGTTSPALKLDVAMSSAGDGIRVYNTLSTGYADVRIGNNSNNNLGFLRVGGSAQGGIYQDALVVGTGGGYPVIFAPQGTERMRIDSSGNVGIGTSSPTNRLFVGSSSSDVAVFQASGGVQAEIFSNSGGIAFGIASGGSLTGNYAYFDSTNFYKVQVNNAEVMRIDSSGNVGIGTTNAGGWKLNISSGSTSKISLFNSVGNGNTIDFADQSWQSQIIGSAGSLLFNTGGTSERMRIDSSGAVRINATAYIGNSGEKLTVVGSGDTSFYRSSGGNGVGTCFHVNRDGGTGNFLYFTYGSGQSPVGSINTNGSTTAYSTTSDYRLKENVAPMQNALNVVQQLKPVTYNWKADGSDGQGFIAHELQAVVPDCVTGEKDAVDKDGKPVYQGIDTSFLVATLTKAIQELKAELDVVKAELNTLKGN